MAGAMVKKTTKPRKPAILTPPVVSKTDEAGYDAVIGELRNAGNNLRCTEVKQLLESLGFVVQRCGRGNHYIVKHSGIPGFYGTDYNCGHGANPKPKPAYIGKLIRVLEANKEYLIGTTT